MAARGVAGRDAADEKFQRLAVKNGDDPADGTNEASAIETRPSHGAGPGKVMHRAGENGCEDLRSGAAEFDLLGGEVLALGSLDQVEAADVDTLLFGEAQRGTRRRADGVVGDRLGRASDFGLDVGLLGEQATNPGRKPAGSAESFDHNAFGWTFGGEEFFDVGAKFFLSFRKHACGNFLAADFEEKFDALVFRGGLPARTSCRGGAPLICSR